MTVTTGHNRVEQHSRARRLVRAILTALMGFALGACAVTSPPPAEYVLGSVPASRPGTLIQTKQPAVLVERVRLPDYLDTTDLVGRKAGELVPSATGRWAERLSVGFTRSLAESLAARLPQALVTAAAPIEHPKLLLAVEVSHFGSYPDHQVTLVARWTVIDGNSRGILLTQQTTLLEPVNGSGDPFVVAAMTRAIDDLSSQIATALAADLTPAL